MKRMGNLPSALGSSKKFENLTADLQLSPADMVGALNISATQPINVYMPDGSQLKEIQHCMVHNTGNTQLTFLDSAGFPLIALAPGRSNLLWAVNTNKYPGTWTALDTTQTTGSGLTYLVNSGSVSHQQICYLGNGCAVMVWYASVSGTPKLQYVIIRGVGTSNMTCLPVITIEPAGTFTDIFDIVSPSVGKCTIVYMDGSGVDRDILHTTMIVDTDGTVTNLVLNSGTGFQGYSSNMGRVAVIGTDKIAMIWPDSSSAILKIAIADITTTSVSFGSAVTVISNSYYGCLCKIGTTKLMAVSIDNTSGDPSACVITFSGTTPTVTTSYSITTSDATGTWHTFDICAVTNDVAVFFATYTSDIKASVLTATGTVVSAGTLTTFYASTGGPAIKTVLMSPNRIGVISYYGIRQTDVIGTIIGNISAVSKVINTPNLVTLSNCDASSMGRGQLVTSAHYATGTSTYVGTYTDGVLV